MQQHTVFLLLIKVGPFTYSLLSVQVPHFKCFLNFRHNKHAMFVERETKYESKYLNTFNVNFHLIEQYLHKWHFNKVDYTVPQCILQKY